MGSWSIEAQVRAVKRHGSLAAAPAGQCFAQHRKKCFGGTGGGTGQVSDKQPLQGVLGCRECPH